MLRMYCVSGRGQKTGVLLTIHLPHGAYIVIRVLEAHKAVALCFACPLVPDHLGLQEGRVAAEGTCQDVVVHLVAKVTTKDAEVI